MMPPLTLLCFMIDFRYATLDAADFPLRCRLRRRQPMPCAALRARMQMRVVTRASGMNCAYERYAARYYAADAADITYDAITRFYDAAMRYGAAARMSASGAAAARGRRAQRAR